MSITILFVYLLPNNTIAGVRCDFAGRVIDTAPHTLLTDEERRKFNWFNDERDLRITRGWFKLSVTECRQCKGGW